MTQVRKFKYAELTYDERQVILRILNLYYCKKDLSKDADAVNVKRISDKLFRKVEDEQ